MPITEEVIYHTTFTCEQCGGSETRTDVERVDEFHTRTPPASMINAAFRIDQTSFHADAIHKTCLMAWIAAQIPP